jgi:ABC-2 type transport system permease protein
MRHYLGLFGIQLRAALLLALQYRLDFVVQTSMVLFWSATAILPLLVLFDMRSQVAGFHRDDALLVAGFFLALKGILLGVVQPSLTNAVEHIRKGTLDFLLLKPADAQFLLSTGKLDLPRLADVISGLGLVAYAANRLAEPPGLLLIALGTGLFICGALVLYAIWILVISLSFRVVKVDNLSFLFSSAFDAARFPAGIFRGIFAFLFTFVLPLAVMTTYPALALRGTIGMGEVLTALGVTAGFSVLARWSFRASIRHYTGAGG